MIFNVWTFLFEVLNFLVLVYVLRRLLYKPLRDAIDERRNANAKAQADAEKAREEALALQQKLNTQLADFEHERQDLFRKAREQSEAERKATMADAEQALQRRRDDLTQQIERERAEALQALRAELLQSAIALAERFLREAAGSTLQQQLAGRLVEELQVIPDDQRQRLREELEAEDTAVVETATTLNGQILESLGDVLKSMTGRPVTLTVQARPDLIAGLRLKIGGHAWDASLNAGLDEVVSTPSGGVTP